MNVQEAVKQTLCIYSDEKEYKAIDQAMDYLLQILKAEDEKRIHLAGDKAIRNPTKETTEPYLSGYRAGWNDAVHEMTMDASNRLKFALMDLKREMTRK